MVKKSTAAPSKAGKKLTVKKEKVKDLSVTPGKGSSVKGGVKVSNPRTPCDPGCRPCG